MSISTDAGLIEQRYEAAIQRASQWLNQNKRSMSWLAKQLHVDRSTLSRFMRREELYRPQLGRRRIMGILEGIEQLCADPVAAVVSSRKGIYEISPSNLGSLDPDQATELFRDLLWSQARRMGGDTTKIVTTSKTSTPDGGVDLSVLPGALPTGVDPLLTCRAGFQVKTGLTAQPWKKSWLRRELFGGKAVSRENLAPGIANILQSDGRYVIVCFGIDPTPELQLPKARQTLIEMLKQCGFEKPNVEVWGQTHLVGLLAPFPSLCLRVAERQDLGIQSHQSWALRADMRLPLHLGQPQQKVVDDIRGYLLGSDIRHLRIVGEPGVGKSRLVLEATSKSDLAPLVIFVSDGADFQKSPLFNALLRSDNDFFTILVIDECLPKDRASIWNVLQHRSDRVRLVTLDHGPEDGHGQQVKLIAVPDLDREKIAEIISEYVASPFESRRWADFCVGSPRVAHLVGENLRDNPSDLLAQPATTDVWSRYIFGHDKPGSENAILRHIALRHIALFERFGFESPVDEEGRFIASLAQATDPRLTWNKFQELVDELQQRRILQGKTTLYITPRLLHIYLYRDFWRCHGRGFNLTEKIGSIPNRLFRWFTGMLPYAHLSEIAEAEVSKLLGSSGLFAEGTAITETLARLLEVLAEANPKEVLAALKRTIGHSSQAQLLAITTGRHSLVSALQKIAVHEALFGEAATLLLALADAENENHANNASGVFISLFDLTGMAATKAPPATRLPILRAAIASPNSARRALGIKACVAAFSRESGGFVSPGHQGLRPEITFWLPRTLNELEATFREVWNLLAEQLEPSRCISSERSHLMNSMIDAATNALNLEIPMIANVVLDTLDTVLDDGDLDRRRLVSLLNAAKRSSNEPIFEDVKKRVEALEKKLTGNTFSSILKRFVAFWDPDDDWDDEEYKPSTVTLQKLEELVLQSIADPELLDAELGWLAKNPNSFRFGRLLGERDIATSLLEKIVRFQESTGSKDAPVLLGGYLAGFGERDGTSWDCQLLELSNRPSIQQWFGFLVPLCRISERITRRAIELGEISGFDIEQFLHWRHGSWIRQIDEHLFLRLQDLLLAKASPSTVLLAVEQCHEYYCDIESTATIPKELVFDLLTHVALFDGRQAMTRDYHWAQVAEHYVDRYPDRGLDLFALILERSANADSFLGQYPRHAVRDLFPKIIQLDANAAWAVIAKQLSDLTTKQAWQLRGWLRDAGPGLREETAGPLLLFNPQILWTWVDDGFPERACWLASCLPKTMDVSLPGGQLTRAFAMRYTENDDVASMLISRFLYGAWCGPTSDHYRGKRDLARQWLGLEVDVRVRKWLDLYIDCLSEHIVRAEIEEERRF